MSKSQINIRVSDHSRRQLDALIERTGLNQTEVIMLALDRLSKEEIKMDKDTDTVYYCPAGGHFWKWGYSIEKAGHFFPAFVRDEEAPEECEELNCGCTN
jgi:hypothetical protein